MTQEQINFVTKLRGVSIQIAEWAKGQFEIGCSIDNVKLRIFDCAKIAGRE